MEISINQKLNKLVEKGLATFPPLDVTMATYLELQITSEFFGNGWIPPTLELLDSVENEVIADIEAELNKPAPKTEIEILREMVELLTIEVLGV